MALHNKPNSNGTSPDDTEHIPLRSKTPRNNTNEHPKGNRSLCQSVKYTFDEYCGNTSLHGVPYFGQQRPWIEKIFWLCAFIISIGFCSDAIRKLYQKWDETPVIVSFSESSTEIWNIPFPAITICSETKRGNRTGPSYMDLLHEFKENPHLFQPNISSNELDEFFTLLHICITEPIDDNDLPAVPHTPIDYFRILQEMSSDLKGYSLMCKWNSRYFTACNAFFTKTFTEEGLCSTFNGLDATDLYRDNTVQYQQMGLDSSVAYNEMLNRSLSWSLEQGYAPNSAFNSYPARVLVSGGRTGFSQIFMSLDKDIDFGCRGASQGFKLLLHSPDDVPLVSEKFVRIPGGSEVLIAVTPNMMTTSDGVAKYDPQKRQCYLSNERYLRFFKVYSENNCELECLTNFTLTRCGCVKFSMPRTPDMPVCGADKIDCYKSAHDTLLLSDLSRGLKGSHNKCNCMPACTSLQYDTEISQGNFEFDVLIKVYNKSAHFPPRAEFSYVSVYYKDNEFITTKRSELYGVFDFLAGCGGICGLFTGFSFLSAVELLYHFSLRLWSNMRR